MSPSSSPRAQGGRREEEDELEHPYVPDINKEEKNDSPFLCYFLFFYRLANEPGSRLFQQRRGAVDLLRSSRASTITGL